MRSLIFFCILMIFACNQKEISTDKFPDIPHFPESSSQNYFFEATSFRPGTKIGNFILEETGVIPEDSLTLFEIGTGKIISIRIEGRLQLIDAKHDFFITEKDSDFYKFRPPDFQKKKLTFEIINSSYDSIRLNGVEATKPIAYISDSLDNIRIRKMGNCMSQLFNDSHYLVSDGKREVIVEPRGIHMALPECTTWDEEETLQPVDEVLLGYSVDGSNHFAFGIESDNLYYYQLMAGSDTIRFKSSANSFYFFETNEKRKFIKDPKNNLYELKRETP